MPVRPATRVKSSSPKMNRKLQYLATIRLLVVIRRPISLTSSPSGSGLAPGGGILVWQERQASVGTKGSLILQANIAVRVLSHSLHLAVTSKPPWLREHLRAPSISTPCDLPARGSSAFAAI